MAIYVVLEPEAASLRQSRERAVLIRDGFSFWAFILPVAWPLVHRLWLEALGALALMMAAGALATQLGGHPVLGSALSLLTQFYFGLEGANLRIRALQRRGWTVWGPVGAVNRKEAEFRYAASADEREIVLEETPWPQRRDEGTRPLLPASTPATVGASTFPWER